MNEKIIIVKIRDALTDVIDRLEISYREKVERYYSISENDFEIAQNNYQMIYPVVFVVFRKNAAEKKDEVICLYMGKGSFDRNAVNWIIKYNISIKKTSNMIIKNFISNSELDLRNDFESHSYINIESSKDLIDQVCFLINPPYETPRRAIDEQNYEHILLEEMHEFCQLNEHCKRPIGRLESTSMRSEFQRDYERIIHAKSFRRLVDKAQIFTSTKGDHYRTRMTHTIEVAQIARAIAKGLRLNVELTEAIALAHDLGHTPFGHQGERTLDNILKNKIKIINHEFEDKNPFGGFKHNFQGIRVVNYLEEKYVEFEGLDLSYQVLEGILKHTDYKLKNCNCCSNCDLTCIDLGVFLPNCERDHLYPELPKSTTLEGQIVSIADEIAQRSHDLDDSFSANILSSDELVDYLSLQKMAALKEQIQSIKNEIAFAQSQNRVFIDINELRHSRIVSAVLDFFINDTITQSKEIMRTFERNELYLSNHRFNEQLIDFSKNGKILSCYLEKIIKKKVINSPEVVRFDNLGSNVIQQLFEAYYKNPKLLHQGTLRRIYVEMRKSSDEVVDLLNGDLKVVKAEIDKIKNPELASGDLNGEYEKKRVILIRAIVDYIAGMTDSYALNEYNKICI